MAATQKKKKIKEETNNKNNGQQSFALAFNFTNWLKVSSDSKTTASNWMEKKS